MATGKSARLGEGHQPYDPINSARVGALTGGLVGAGVVVVSGGQLPLLIVAGAAIGGLVGFFVGRRETAH